MYNKYDSSKPSAVDLCKLILAICILTIHTSLFKPLPSFVEWIIYGMLLRMGVPYFFIASGFFYWQKVKKVVNSAEKVRICENNYIMHNLHPFLFFSSASLVVHTALAFHRTGINGAMETIHNAVFYPLGAMWFVSSCMMAVVVITELRNHRKLLYIIAISGYMFALLSNTYWFFVSETKFSIIIELYLEYFVSARNGIFIGIYLFGIGVLLSENKETIDQLSLGKIISVIAVLTVAQLMEILLVYGKPMKDDSSLFIIMPHLAAAIFLFSLKIYMPYSLETSKQLRRLSTYIYFLHPLFNATIGTIILIKLQNVVLNTIIVFSCCILTWISTQKSKNKCIRKVLP